LVLRPGLVNQSQEFFSAATFGIFKIAYPDLQYIQNKDMVMSKTTGQTKIPKSEIYFFALINCYLNLVIVLSGKI